MSDAKSCLGIFVDDVLCQGALRQDSKRVHPFIQSISSNNLKLHSHWLLGERQSLESMSCIFGNLMRKYPEGYWINIFSKELKDNNGQGKRPTLEEYYFTLIGALLDKFIGKFGLRPQQIKFALPAAFFLGTTEENLEIPRNLLELIREFGIAEPLICDAALVAVRALENTEERVRANATQQVLLSIEVMEDFITVTAVNDNQEGNGYAVRRKRKKIDFKIKNWLKNYIREKKLIFEEVSEEELNAFLDKLFQDTPLNEKGTLNIYSDSSVDSYISKEFEYLRAERFNIEKALFAELANNIFETRSYGTDPINEPTSNLEDCIDSHMLYGRNVEDLENIWADTLDVALAGIGQQDTPLVKGIAIYGYFASNTIMNDLLKNTFGAIFNKPGQESTRPYSKVLGHGEMAVLCSNSYIGITGLESKRIELYYALVISVVSETKKSDDEVIYKSETKLSETKTQFLRHTCSILSKGTVTINITPKYSEKKAFEGVNFSVELFDWHIDKRLEVEARISNDLIVNLSVFLDGEPYPIQLVNENRVHRLGIGSLLLFQTEESAKSYKDFQKFSNETKRNYSFFEKIAQ